MMDEIGIGPWYVFRGYDDTGSLSLVVSNKNRVAGATIAVEEATKHCIAEIRDLNSATIWRIDGWMTDSFRDLLNTPPADK